MMLQTLLLNIQSNFQILDKQGMPRQQQVVEKHIIGAKKEVEDVKSQRGNVDHQGDNVKHVYPRLEPKQERINDPEIIFLGEPIEENRIKSPMVAKFLRIHQNPEKIIGDNESSVMTRKIFKDDTC